MVVKSLINFATSFIYATAVGDSIVFSVLNLLSGWNIIPFSSILLSQD